MHTQWECSVLQVHCSKPAKPAHRIPAGRWDSEEPTGSEVMPRWQQPALAHCKALWLHQRWASWEEQQRSMYFRDTCSGGKGILLTFKKCTQYIYTHLLRSLALMVKLKVASKKSCSKRFLILFLFNEWEMLPNSEFKSSIFLKKQVVEGSLWLLADTVHAQLKNMPAWHRVSNQAPGRTHSFPEVMKYSKNL